MSPQTPRDIPPQVKIVSLKPTNPPCTPDLLIDQPVTHNPDVFTNGGGHPVVVLQPPPVDREHNVPQQPQRSHPQKKTRHKRKISEKEVLTCLVPNCHKTFRRSDSRVTHLRTKHNFPIPKGCWAKAWVPKIENKPFYSAAVKAQAHANKILSPRQNPGNGPLGKGMKGK